MTHGFSGDWRLAEALFQRPESIETEPPSLYAAQGEHPPCAACVRVFCPGRQGQALRALRGLDGMGGAGMHIDLWVMQPCATGLQPDAALMQPRASPMQPPKWKTGRE